MAASDVRTPPVSAEQLGSTGDAEGFNIFELSTNDKGEPMLKHAPLGDASPVEVRERSVSVDLWRFWMIIMVYTLPARTMHSTVWTGWRNLRRI